MQRRDWITHRALRLNAKGVPYAQCRGLAIREWRQGQRDLSAPVDAFRVAYAAPRRGEDRAAAYAAERGDSDARVAGPAAAPESPPDFQRLQDSVFAALAEACDGGGVTLRDAERAVDCAVARLRRAMRGRD